MKKIKYKNKNKRKEYSDFSNIGTEISERIKEAVTDKIRERIPSYSGGDNCLAYRELKDCLVYKVNLPGFEESEINISVDSCYLKISAERQTAGNRISNRFSFSIPRGFKPKQENSLRTKYNGRILEIRLIKSKI